MASYSSIGPFSRREAESFDFPGHAHDPLFDYRTSLELLGVEALFVSTGENEQSESHHDGGLLTVLFGGRRLVLCENPDPFRAYYIGTSECVGMLREGMVSNYRTELDRAWIDIGRHISDGMNECFVTGLVENVYGNDGFHAYSHKKLALGHIGIRYEKEYVEEAGIDEKDVMRRVEELRRKCREWAGNGPRSV